MARPKSSTPLLLSAAAAAALLSACLAEPVDPVETATGGGLSPFYSASFDHVPTPGEIDQALTGFLTSAGGKEHRAVVTPGGATAPGPGYKLVTLTVKTGGNANDGMDSASKAYFSGTWAAVTTFGVDSAYSEKFILNDPSRDDLDRNATDVFYYLLPLDTYVGGVWRDQFKYGRIGNTSTDLWRCQYVWVDDRNHRGTGRVQTLNFDTAVEAPSPQESVGLTATNTDWLSYRD